MTTKKLAVLGGVAAVLVAAVWLTGGKDKARGPQLNGERLVEPFDLSEVGSVQIGAVKLVSGGEGWTIPALQDYPVDVAKLNRSLLKLQDLKVGQVARGRGLGQELPVVVRSADGHELAALMLGDQHEKWDRGRYVRHKGETVLVGDRLDEFGTDPKGWCDTKVVDTPYIRFTSLAAPDLADETLGFATGVVAKVTIGGDTNRTVTVGNAVPGGTDRYLKVDGLKWTFVVPSYSVDSLLPKPPSAEPGEKEPETADPADAAEK